MIWTCARSSITAVVFFALSVGGCPDEGEQAEPAPQSQKTAPSPAAGEATAPSMQGPNPTCPLSVQGVDVVVGDTQEGIALTFSTVKGQVSDLQERVRRMAQLYEEQRGRGGMMWRRMGRGGAARGGMARGRAGQGWGQGRGSMAGLGPMPAVNTIVTDADSGARLELRPTDPSQLEALRQHVRLHQQRMQSGECWGLSGMPTESTADSAN